MKRFSLSTFLVVGVMATGDFWAACGPKPPPGPTPEEIAAREAAERERARLDSIRRAEEEARLRREAEERRRREEEERRRREEEEARRRAEEEARRMAMLNTIYFDFDKFNIREDQRPALDENARRLREYRPEDRVLIEGHCDERGTIEYNLALGERRANAVKQYLINSGIDAGRLDTISYGEERPVDPGHNEAAWAKNRRAELKRIR